MTEASRQRILEVRGEASLRAVTDAMPQKNWPTIEMRMRSLAPAPPTARRMSSGAELIPTNAMWLYTGTASAPVPNVPFGMARVIARFRMNAAIAET